LKEENKTKIVIERKDKKVKEAIIIFSLPFLLCFGENKNVVGPMPNLVCRIIFSCVREIHTFSHNSLASFSLSVISPIPSKA
jgi:hypothetical protein